MAENDHVKHKTRTANRMAIVVLICFLLSYCAHRLYSAWDNGSPPPMSVSQKIVPSDAPGKADAPLLSTKQETIPSAGINQALPGSLEKETHRQEKSPAASNSVKAKPETSQVQGAQSRDSEQPQETAAPSKVFISKPKNVRDKDQSESSPNETLWPEAGAVAQAPDVHHDNSAEKDFEAFDATFTEPISGMEFILVTGGCYQMGSDLTAFEGPVHEVCVDDFYLSKYEVTQTQWTKIMGRHFSYFKGNLRPVERVTWNDSQRFIRQLNSRSGAVYRLPTEAEWEYAARSRGTDKVYSGTSEAESLASFAWHQVNSNRETHMVGMKKPNSLGLHDMSGNVWEWCSDWYAESYYANSARNNPQGPGTGIYRVIRGGEWELPGRLTRATYREAAKPHVRRYDIGFRLALSLPKKQ